MSISWLLYGEGLMHMITKRIGQMLKLRLLLETLTPSELNMKLI